MTSAARSGPPRLVVQVVLVVVLVSGIVAMREATQSRHEPMPPDSRIRVLIAPSSKRPESSQSTESVVRAQLAFCQLEVGSRMEGPLEHVSDDPLRYAVIMAPALDSTDKKQFRGCVEDWIVDNHRLDVVEIEEIDVP